MSTERIVMATKEGRKLYDKALKNRNIREDYNLATHYSPLGEIRIYCTADEHEILDDGTVRVRGTVSGVPTTVDLLIKEAVEECLIDHRWRDWDSTNVTVNQYKKWLACRRPVKAKYPLTSTGFKRFKR